MLIFKNEHYSIANIGPRATSPRRFAATSTHSSYGNEPTFIYYNLVILLLDSKMFVSFPLMLDFASFALT